MHKATFSEMMIHACDVGGASTMSITPDSWSSGVRRQLARAWFTRGGWVERYEAARSQFASFIGATADEVAIIPYASAGINSIASALTEKR